MVHEAGPRYFWRSNHLHDAISPIRPSFGVGGAAASLVSAPSSLGLRTWENQITLKLGTFKRQFPLGPSISELSLVVIELDVSGSPVHCLFSLDSLVDSPTSCPQHFGLHRRPALRYCQTYCLTGFVPSLLLSVHGEGAMTALFSIFTRLATL